MMGNFDDAEERWRQHARARDIDVEAGTDVEAAGRCLVKNQQDRRRRDGNLAKSRYFEVSMIRDPQGAG